MVAIAGAIKAAFNTKIEDLGDIDSIATLVAAVKAQGDPNVLQFYEQMATMAEPAEQVIQVGFLRSNQAFDIETLANCAVGTLGHAYYQLVKATNLPYNLANHPKLTGLDKESAEYFVTLRTLETQDIWRVVLGYGADPYSDFALQAFIAAQQFSLESMLWLSILLHRVAFINPEAIIPVYDSLTDGWLRGKAAQNFLPVRWEEKWNEPLDQIRTDLNVPPAYIRDEKLMTASLPLLQHKGHLPDGLPALFWETLENLETATITEQIAALGRTFSPEYVETCARAVRQHRGMDKVLDEYWLPARIKIENLSHYPPGTLGYIFYHLIVDNNLAVDILDPDSILTHNRTIDYVNRRILQTHDVWHLVGGYTTSPLHEVAISAFQLAQFGQDYSARFFATVMTLLTLTNPFGIPYVMQITAEGWQHGRTTLPMMSVRWEDLWDKSIEELRQEYKIVPFVTTVPEMEMA